MGKLYFLFTTLGIIITSATQSWGGAWSMNEGGLYAKLSLNHYFTNYTFTEGGGKQRLPKDTNFTDNNTTLYMEYGITDRLTASGSLPYKWLRSSYRRQITVDDQTTTERVVTHWNGFGDMELGLKYCFLKEPFVSALQLLYKNAWFYNSEEKIPPGNNQDDYELRFLVGKSLWPFPGYCGAEIGYRWRNGKPSDEYRYLLEFGMSLTQKLSWRIKLDGIKSVKNAELPPSTYSTDQEELTNPSLGLEYDLGKLEFTTSYQVAKRWFCELSYTNYPYGKNVSPGDQYSFAIVYYFTKK